jgi:hypothetical protein
LTKKVGLVFFNPSFTVDCMDPEPHPHRILLKAGNRSHVSKSVMIFYCGLSHDRSRSRLILSPAGAASNPLVYVCLYESVPILSCLWIGKSSVAMIAPYCRLYTLPPSSYPPLVTIVTPPPFPRPPYTPPQTGDQLLYYLEGGAKSC